ncbi:MAG: hypothetical protein JW940_32070, partial [Polyangiaceae bacterium]|nr:hypothetical protein [Polyangiaceae bacterium]
MLSACWAFCACDATGEPDIAQGGNASDAGGRPTAGSGGVSASSATGGAPIQHGGSSSSSEAGGSSAVDGGNSGDGAAGSSSSPLGGAPPSGGTSSTGGTDGPGPSGGVSSGGATVASGGQPSGGGLSNRGGAEPSGGTSNRGGARSSGGTGPGGGTSATGGTSANCTDIVPPGNDSCANAVEWGWCTADWIGDYCAATCGRCGSTSSGGTGSGTGGSATGGGSASPTGGTGSGNLSVPRLNGGQQASTTRYWDCCKPSCAWRANAGGKNPATTCGKDGNSTVGEDARNACESGGTAFQCNWGVPWQVGPSLSYGYVAFNSGGCGTCYQLDFPNGKTMIVQAINIGAMSGSNFDLLIPGGGVGAMNACTQNGAMWGNVDAGVQHGGFLASCGPNMSCITDMCRNAFGSNAALMAGC